MTYRYNETAHAATNLALAQLVRLRRCCICALVSSAIRPALRRRATAKRPLRRNEAKSETTGSDAQAAAAMAAMAGSDSNAAKGLFYRAPHTRACRTSVQREGCRCFLVSYRMLAGPAKNPHLLRVWPFRLEATPKMTETAPPESSEPKADM